MDADQQEAVERHRGELAKDDPVSNGRAVEMAGSIFSKLERRNCSWTSTVRAAPSGTSEHAAPTDELVALPDFDSDGESIGVVDVRYWLRKLRALRGECQMSDPNWKSKNG